MIFWSISVASHSRGPAFSVHGKGWWKPRGWPHPGAASVLNSRVSPSRLKAIHRMARGRNGPSVWELSLRSSAHVKCRARTLSVKEASKKDGLWCPACRADWGAWLSARFQPTSPAVVEQDPWILPWVTLSDLLGYFSYLQQGNHGAKQQPLASVTENAGRSVGKGSWFHLVSSFLFLFFFFFSPLKRITYSLT